MVFRRFIQKSQKPSRTDTVSLVLEGTSLDVTLRRNARSRRLSLKVDARSGQPVLVLPPHVSDREALGFLEDQSDWLFDQLGQLPPPVRFEEGANVPLRGRDYRVVHDPDRRHGVRVQEDEAVLLVAGGREHLARRLRDHLKRQAREDITPLARSMAADVGRRAGRISIRDQRSRWGSCSAKGDLSFNWRLILAPSSVLTYVVAHEVAHLVEHNHSSAFWSVVRQLDPDADCARRWLRDNGAALQRVG